MSICLIKFRPKDEIAQKKLNNSQNEHCHADHSVKVSNVFVKEIKNTRVSPDDVVADCKPNRRSIL